MSLLKQYKEEKNKKPFVQYSTPLNPFNSWKVMYHMERMQSIDRWMDIMDIYYSNNEDYKNILLPPVYVTVDPTDICNHGCPWCISSQIQESDNTTLKKELMESLGEFLGKWRRKVDDLHMASVKAVVLAGGGEPLANKSTIDFVKVLSENYKKYGLEYSIITNGELLTDKIAEIVMNSASWIGFSVDAGDTESHKLQHAPKKKNVDNFKIIIDNIKMMCDMKKDVNKRISRVNDKELNVGYKFNIHPYSYKTMLEAARIAKEIGCNQIQFKPTYVDNPEELFTPEIIQESQNNISKCRELYEDDNFKVVGMIHKVGTAWEAVHDFTSCKATPLGLIFSADGNMYLCCDRRGVPELNLGRWHDGNIARGDWIDGLWGSKKHYELIKNINLSECPRCTFRFYNQVMDKAIEDKDPMDKNFL